MVWKTNKKFGFAAAAVVLMLADPVAGALIQLDISSSLNRDIVFAGGSDGVASADGVNLALVSQSAANAVATPVGLPDNGQLSFGGGTVQLASYSASNAVHFGFGGGFTFNVGLPLSTLTLHGFSAFGNANLGLTLNYATGSPQTPVVVLRDWTNNNVSASRLIDDTDGYRTDTALVVDLDDLSIFNVDVPVDETRSLVSVSVQQTDGELSDRVSNILAVSADAVVIPEPMVAVLTLIGGGVLLARSGRDVRDLAF